MGTRVRLWQVSLPNNASGAPLLMTAVAVDHSNFLDPPDTPAPVFALRAFKTALFGTPREGTEEQVATPNPTARPAAAAAGDTTPARHSSDDADAAVQSRRRLRHGEDLLSTKPAGILLTPGTANGRRKTVSFGETVVDNESKKATSTGRSGLPDNCPGKFPSPWTPKSTSWPRKSGRNTFTQSLYDARSVKTDNTDNVSKPDVTTAASSQVVPVEKAQDLPSENRARAGKARQRQALANDGDNTVDLDDPRSGSGKYWKSELQNYHEKSMDEIRKLVKYKDMAKSYARKKDAEAMELGEKLREEKQKVARMEIEISELAGAIATRRIDGKGDDSDQRRMMKDLARQTAAVLEYKDKVNHFEAALERNEDEGHGAAFNSPRSTSPRTQQTLIQISKELKKAREQVHEMKVLQAELDGLRGTVKESETRAQKLDDEKSSLGKELTRFKEAMETNEKRRKAREERQKAREDRLETEKNHLRGRIGQMKIEHRNTVEDLKRRHGRECADLKLEIAVLKSEKTSHPIPSNVALSSLKVSSTTDHALSDLDINTSYDNLPGKPLREPERIDKALHDESEHFRLDDSLPQLPSPEHPFSVSRRADKTKGHSPYVSIFEVPSSPPKLQPFSLPLNTAGTPRREVHVHGNGVRRNASTTASSSRMGSLGTSGRRKTLPPERAAAAKARLEERRRLQEQERARQDAGMPL